MFRGAFVLVAVSVAGMGCSSDPVFPNATPGREGILGFAFGGNQTEECFGACKADRPIAAGATSQVNITEGDPTRRFRGRVPDSVGLEFRELFFCERGDGTFREVEFGQTCAEAEELTSLRIAEVLPTQPGTFALEVLDDGELVDSIELDARPVVGARFMTARGPEIIDELTIGHGGSDDIQPLLRGEGDTSLYGDDFEFEWSSDDPAVAEIGTEPTGMGIGSVPVHSVGPGQTNLRLHAFGIEIVLPVFVE